MKLLKLVGFVFSLLTILSSGIVYATFDDAIVTDIAPSGFSFVSQQLHKNILVPINREPLADISTQSNGVQIRVKQIYYTLSFETVNVAPGNGVLGFSAGIRNLRINIERIKMFKKTGPVYQESNCYDSTIYIGEDAPVYLNAQFAAQINNGHIGVTAPYVGFHIDENKYRVAGPASCKGNLTVGELAKFAVHETLKKQKGNIEDAIKKKVYDSIPTLENTINGFLTRRLPLTIDQFPELPSQSTTILLNPSAINFTPERMRLMFALNVEEYENYEEAPSFIPELMTAPIDPQILYGDVGFNPKFIGDILQQLYPNGTSYIEVTESLVPGIHEKLSVEHLKDVWPDLGLTQASEPFLKVFIRADKMPAFYISDDGTAVMGHFPRMQLKFAVNKGGQWLDYYIVDVDLTTGVEPNMITNETPQKLQLSIIFNTEVHVSGNWAPGYTPIDPTFNAGLVEELFMFSFRYLYSQGPITTIDMPSVQIADKRFSLTNVRLNPPFMMGDVID